MLKCYNAFWKKNMHNWFLLFLIVNDDVVTDKVLELLERMEKNMDEKLERVQKHMNEKLVPINDHVKRVGEKCASVEEKFQCMDDKFQRIDDKLDQLKIGN